LTGTVSICTLAMLSIHRLLGVKNIRRAKIASYSQGSILQNYISARKVYGPIFNFVKQIKFS
jgi:hypothetical protein